MGPATSPPLGEVALQGGATTLGIGTPGGAIDRVLMAHSTEDSDGSRWLPPDVPRGTSIARHHTLTLGEYTRHEPRFTRDRSGDEPGCDGRDLPLPNDIRTLGLLKPEPQRHSRRSAVQRIYRAPRGATRQPDFDRPRSGACPGLDRAKRRIDPADRVVASGGQRFDRVWRHRGRSTHRGGQRIRQVPPLHVPRGTRARVGRRDWIPIAATSGSTGN